MTYLAAQAKGILYCPSRWHVCLAAFSTFGTVCGSTHTKKQKKQDKTYRFNTSQKLRHIF